jgi:hypothetical protein
MKRIYLYCFIILLVLLLAATSFAQSTSAEPHPNSQLGNSRLQSPKDEAEVPGTTITFRWQAVSGATLYQLQLWNSEDDEIVLTEDIIGESKTSIAISGFPNDGTEFAWRVRARNASGPGPWSEMWYFHNGNLDDEHEHPMDYRGRNNETFDFVVTGSLFGVVWGTNIYTDDSHLGTAAVHAGVLQVGETKTVSVMILPGQSSYTGSTKNGVTSLNYGSWHGSYKFVGDTATQYRVRVSASPPAGGSATGGGTYNRGESVTVRAMAETGYTFKNWTEGKTVVSKSAVYTFSATADRSLVANFQASATRPGRPVLVRPAANDALVGARVKFEWKRVTGATRYQLEIRRASNNQLFKRVNIAGASNLARVLPGFPNNQTQFKWRVRASNASGFGPWSAYKSFTSGAVLPQRPQLVNPGNQETMSGDSVRFNWHPVAHATNYQLEIRRASDNSLVKRANIKQEGRTFFVLPGFPEDGTAYKWRISARNSSRNGPWSQYRTFVSGAGGFKNKVHGPGGIVFDLPDEAAQYDKAVSLQEHGASDILKTGEQAASAVVRVNIGSGTSIGGHANAQQQLPIYELKFPLTLNNIDPNRLRLRVKVADGVVLPVPGRYDAATGSYVVNTYGLGHNWVMGVVAGEPVSVSAPVPISRDSVQTLQQENPYHWPSLDVHIWYGMQNKHLSEENIESTFRHVARDVLIRMQSAGFLAPAWQRDNVSGGYYLCLINEEVDHKNSYYQPAKDLLGLVYIYYPDLIGDYSKTSTYKLKNTLAHEIFHAVQAAYGIKSIELEDGYFKDQQSKTPLDTAYLEGTANLVGGTYEASTSLGPKSASVSLSYGWEAVPWGSHELSDRFDDFNSEPYVKQDFFAFVAKRNFNGSLEWLDGLFNLMWLWTSDSAGSDAEELLKNYREAFDSFLDMNNWSLPAAYREYALQRLYLHEPDYLLREAEKTDPWFKKNYLNANLLSVDKYSNWKSAKVDKFDYAPLTITDIKPMSAAAVTVEIPSQPPQNSIPITIKVSGGQVNSVMAEEGIGIVILREIDCSPVESNASVVVHNTDSPIEVSLEGGVTNLRIIIINAYVQNKTVDVTLSVKEEEEAEVPDFIAQATSISIASNLRFGLNVFENGSQVGTDSQSVTMHVGDLVVDASGRTVTGSTTYNGDDSSTSTATIKFSSDWQRIISFAAQYTRHRWWVDGSTYDVNESLSMSGTMQAGAAGNYFLPKENAGALSYTYTDKHILLLLPRYPNKVKERISNGSYDVPSWITSAASVKFSK